MARILLEVPPEEVLSVHENSRVYMPRIFLP